MRDPKVESHSTVNVGTSQTERRGKNATDQGSTVFDPTQLLGRSGVHLPNTVLHGLIDVLRVNSFCRHARHSLLHTHQVRVSTWRSSSSLPPAPQP